MSVPSWGSYELPCKRKKMKLSWSRVCLLQLSALNASNCNTNVLEILIFRRNQGRKLISCCDSLCIALRMQVADSLKVGST